MSASLRRFAVACVMTLGLQGCAGTAIMPQPPPPPRLEPPPPAPAGRHVWIPGHWTWNGHRYFWVAGRWLPGEEGSWVPGRWEKQQRGWIWLPGHWKR